MNFFALPSGGMIMRHAGLARFVVAATAIAITGWAAAAETNVLPLPALPRGPIEMRVVYVVNPRLPRMDTAQLQILLAATKKASWEHFRVDLRFTAPQEMPIEELFRRIPAERRRLAFDQIYDFKTDKGDRVRFETAFGVGLKKNGEPIADIMRFARPHMEGEPAESSYEALGVALARLQLRRIERWKNVRALDGGPAIDSSPYNEFLLWDAIGYGDLPFELVLTNQVIASVEYTLPAVHAAIRGGYSNGVTTYSLSSRLNTAAVWSTFAFTTNDAWLVRMRGGETYDPKEAARLAGIAAAHEIGHQLFHFAHPFGNSACIMNPVPMFAFRAWADKLAPKDCPIGSSPAMRPGAYQFHY